MKISFEGNTIRDVVQRIRETLVELDGILGEVNPSVAAPLVTPQGPGPAPVPKDNVPVDKAVDNPGITSAGKKPRTAKQLENDERLRAAAQAKADAKRAATVEGSLLVEKAPPPKAAKPKPVEKAAPPQPQQDEMFQEPVDPAEMVKIRQKTIEDLQSAYANGFQKEVFELLARFGNGAKSFRELPPEAFMPIRKEIDNGALT